MMIFRYNGVVLKLAILGVILTLVSCSGSKKLSARDQKVQVIVKSARTYTGTPYKYGGTTRAGMDCSALLCHAYNSGGVTLPRTSKDQSKLGKAVSIDKVQPGDLVFFSKKKGRRKITHVGMVTEVVDKNHVKFIHASTKLGVVESNLYSNYYRGVFVKARRVI